MQKITAELLGSGRILLNGKQVNLPFKQAEALVYYLLVEKETFRPKLADIIWGDSADEHKVQSNMRNAIYVIRREFGRDFLVGASKNVIQINPEIRIDLDIDRFNDKNLTDFSFYAGDFLENFYLKDNEYYNEWLLNNRQHYRGLLQERLKESIVAAFQDERYKDCELECQKLMALDEFDEFGYVYLIEIYRARGEYSSAVALYDRLEKLLSEELFQSPSKEITALVQNIRQERNKSVLHVLSQKESITSPESEKDSGPFMGREEERGKLVDDILQFSGGRGAISLAVTGEAGIGKTQLFQTVLSSLGKTQAAIYQTCCYRAEENYVLKPWQNIFEQLGRDLKNRASGADATLFRAAVSRAFPYLWQVDLEKAIDQDDITTESGSSNLRAITYALMRLSHAQRMIFYFDDLQWADSVSISLIRDILTSDKNHRILFLFGVRDERHQYVGSFLEEMKAARFLSELQLPRFSVDETGQLADLLLPERFSTPALRQQLFRETEGNPFFIIETVNNLKFNGSVADITPNMRDTIRIRIMSLPSEERSILDLLSFFFDGASFDMMRSLSGKEEYELITILEKLIDKKLIREVIRAESVAFQFSHQKILEYVYGELSLTKRRILHEKISCCLERRLSGTSADNALYTKLMYHSRRAGNERKYLKYYVEYVYNYLNLSHEYYPVLGGETLPTDAENDLRLDSSDRAGILCILKDIQTKVQANQGKFDESDKHGFLSDYYHMMGRFHIRKVEYSQGEPYIRTLIELNRDSDSEQCRNNMIKAYRQLICIYIDRYETKQMHEVVEKAFAVLGEDGKAEERAIWMRLSGLCSIMSGRIEEGYASLTQAIEIFERSGEKDKYLFNLAASYAWLGEVERNRMHYGEAMQYYTRAISICTENFLTGGIATFYTYAGQAALDAGDLESADEYLSQAVDQFNKVELMWGRGIAFAYYGYLCFEQGEYRKALSLFIKADDYAQRLGSCYEVGVLNSMFAQISLQMQDSPDIQAVFGRYLNKDVSVYLQQSKMLLRDAYSPVDEQYLSQLTERLKRENKANTEQTANSAQEIEHHA